MKKENKGKGIVMALAFVLALMLFCGHFIDMVSDREMTMAAFIRRHLLESAVQFAAFAAAIYFAIKGLYSGIDAINAGIPGPNSRLMTKKALFIYWAVIFACWVPYLIVCYPASSIGWDYSWQLLQGSGVVPLTGHHPVVASLVYGGLYKIGFVFGGANGGLFFTGLFQTALMSFAMAYAFQSVGSMGAPRWVVRILVGFTCLCPVFAGHGVWLIKDSIYSSLVVLLVVLCLNDRRNKGKKGASAALVLVAALTAMFRNEAVAVVALMLLALFVNTVRRKDRREVKRVGALALASLTLIFGTRIGINMAGVKSPEVARESLTMLSAQIANCLGRHLPEITDQEREVLDRSYTNLDDVISSYNEENRDPVKTINMSSGETLDYLKVWLQLGLRYKGEYIDTFLRGSDGYWWLFKDPALIRCPTPLYAPEEDFANDYLRDRVAIEHKWLKDVYEAYGLQTDKTIGELVTMNNPDLEGIFAVRSAFPEARDKVVEILDRCKEIPLIQLVFVPGFYFLIALVSLGYLSVNRRRVFWQCLPVMLIVVFDLFSPINGYVRYFLPVALVAIVMAGLCFTGKQDKASPSHAG